MFENVFTETDWILKPQSSNHKSWHSLVLGKSKWAVKQLEWIWKVWASTKNKSYRSQNDAGVPGGKGSRKRHDALFFTEEKSSAPGVPTQRPIQLFGKEIIYIMASIPDCTSPLPQRTSKVEFSNSAHHFRSHPSIYFLSKKNYLFQRAVSDTHVAKEPLIMSIASPVSFSLAANDHRGRKIRKCRLSSLLYKPLLRWYYVWIERMKWHCFFFHFLRVFTTLICDFPQISRSFFMPRNCTVPSSF